ncbi:hypothetical protein [Teichococcus aestuarii]|uniref:hypothetical protein n=1 Tax=Teichococcus aestuarii TaxID=568898 RepID=UPI00360DC2D7
MPAWRRCCWRCCPPPAPRPRRPPAPAGAAPALPALGARADAAPALAEWEEWGRIVVEPTAGPALHEDAPGGLPGPESAAASFPRVLAYWRATEEGEAAIARNRARYANALADPGAPASLWSEPAWSAAFISYVMRGAGWTGGNSRPPPRTPSTSTA